VVSDAAFAHATRPALTKSYIAPSALHAVAALRFVPETAAGRGGDMPVDNTYDFIVTGAGSAGCTVAGRLSESGKYPVRLFEATTKDTNPPGNL
jgi:hypothetical protein